MEMTDQQGLVHYRCMRKLLTHFPLQPLEDIVKCCDDYVAKGHQTDGLVVKYFKAYFLPPAP